MCAQRAMRRAHAHVVSKAWARASSGQLQPEADVDGTARGRTCLHAVVRATWQRCSAAAATWRRACAKWRRALQRLSACGSARASRWHNGGSSALVMGWPQGVHAGGRLRQLPGDEMRRDIDRDFAGEQRSRSRGRVQWGI
jgi:hypothetical protein